MEIHLADMEAAGLNDAAEFFGTMMTKLFNTEMDLGYYKMVADGRWPIEEVQKSIHSAKNKMN